MAKKKRKLSVKDTFWLAPDGYVDTDDQITSLDEVAIIDPDVQALVSDWKKLKDRVAKARYDGVEPYAVLSRKNNENNLILKVTFFHPGFDLDTPLPDDKVSSIKERVRRLKTLLVSEGLTVEDLDDDEALTSFWLALPKFVDFERALDELVRLSVEFGLEEFLWDHK